MVQIDVSVIIAAKNEQIYIESALKSVLDQRGLNFEVLLVDDGSTDSTREIATRVGEQYANFSLFRNPKTGKCSAFNYGVSLAQGRFVCIFAGDDIMPSGSLAARWGAVRDLPDDIPGVGLCKLTTMSEDKRLDGHLVPRKRGRGALSGASPLMNHRAVEKIFPVPEFLPNEDTWMEIAILHYPGWNIVHSDIIGWNWRLHSGNSINLLVAFPEYNKKITARLRAYSLFYEAHRTELDDEGRRTLLAKVECEKSRAAGNMFGVILSSVGMIDKLRALAITNSFLYEIRRRLYGLLSGW